ncbi:MAG: phenol hydroxylase subunit P4 [Gammaproteobacteria bacterium]
MSVKHLGPAYEYPSANRVEAYGGDINFYIRWERHLMFACPAAYRAPTAMPLGEFLETMLKPDYAAHPDAARLDFSRCAWKLDRAPWQPDFARSIADNGIGHMSYIEFASPGLDGLHGHGY